MKALPKAMLNAPSLELVDSQTAPGASREPLVSNSATTRYYYSNAQPNNIADRFGANGPFSKTEMDSAAAVVPPHKTQTVAESTHPTQRINVKQKQVSLAEPLFDKDTHQSSEALDTRGYHFGGQTSFITSAKKRSAQIKTFGPSGALGSRIDLGLEDAWSYAWGSHLVICQASELGQQSGDVVKVFNLKQTPPQILHSHFYKSHAPSRVWGAESERLYWTQNKKLLWISPAENFQLQTKALSFLEKPGGPFEDAQQWRILKAWFGVGRQKDKIGFLAKAKDDNGQMSHYYCVLSKDLSNVETTIEIALPESAADAHIASVHPKDDRFVILETWKRFQSSELELDTHTGTAKVLPKTEERLYRAERRFETWLHENNMQHLGVKAMPIPRTDAFIVRAEHATNDTEYVGYVIGDKVLWNKELPFAEKTLAFDNQLWRFHPGSLRDATVYTFEPNQQETTKVPTTTIDAKEGGKQREQTPSHYDMISVRNLKPSLHANSVSERENLPYPRGTLFEALRGQQGPHYRPGYSTENVEKILKDLQTIEKAFDEKDYAQLKTALFYQRDITSQAQAKNLLNQALWRWAQQCFMTQAELDGALQSWKFAEASLRSTDPKPIAEHIRTAIKDNQNKAELAASIFSKLNRLHQKYFDAGIDLKTVDYRPFEKTPGKPRALLALYKFLRNSEGAGSNDIQYTEQEAQKMQELFEEYSSLIWYRQDYEALAKAIDYSGPLEDKDQATRLARFATRQMYFVINALEQKENESHHTIKSAMNLFWRHGVNPPEILESSLQGDAEGEDAADDIGYSAFRTYESDFRGNYKYLQYREYPPNYIESGEG